LKTVPAHAFVDDAGLRRAVFLPPDSPAASLGREYCRVKAYNLAQTRLLRKMLPDLKGLASERR
jgi:hypothetical protein